MSDASIKGNQLTESCTNLVELLQNRALHQPEQKYTFLLDGKTETASLTYRELDAIARSHAVRLQTLGVSGERALLLFPPGLDYLAAFFGCLYAKVIAVPLYPPKLKRNLAKISAIAKDAGATIAIAPARHLENLEQLCEQAPELKAMRWLSAEVLSDDAQKWQQPRIHPDEVAYLQYTSGSTSTPKGVMVSHANVLYNIEYIHRGFDHDAESVAVTWLPPFHDMGLIDGLLKPLYLGIPSYFMPPAAFIQNPMCWLEAISRYKATHSGGPNFAYDLCASKISKILGDCQKMLDLSSWRVAYNGAEPIHKETLERFTKAFEPCGFQADAFCPAYGMAETTLKIATVRSGATPTFLPVDAGALENNQIVEVLEGEGGARTLVGCGFPEFGTKVAIVNPESLRQCQQQEVGEIWVAGETVARGYWNRPEETEKTFQAYVLDTSEGPFLRTGDLGFLRDRELFITGRLKDLIIIRGRNLYPQDIERTAERSHPSLRQGAIAAFSVEVAGEEQLVIVQELQSRKAPDHAEEIISAIRFRIAQEYEVQVYGVVLIKPGSIPKTTSGKIQRRAAYADFIADNLEVVTSSVLELADSVEIDDQLTREILLNAELEERQSLLEAYLWQQVNRRGMNSPANSQSRLKATEDESSIHFSASGKTQDIIDRPLSSFGLDSLRIFELKNQIESDLGVTVSVADLFEDRSIARLAVQILEQLTGNTKALVIGPASRSRHLPLSFAQERLWFFDQLEPGNPFYNLCGAVRVTGQLNAEALRQSIEKIIERHEVLRTAFVAAEGEPIQVVAAAGDWTLPLIDLSDRSPDDRQAQVQRLSAQEARAPFDLGQSSLLRAKLLRLDFTEHVLLLTVHHIVFDGWSLGVFLRELAEFYQAFSSNDLPLLSPLPIQYADFAAWQRQQLQGEILETQLGYWKQQLSGSLPILNLPTDFPRPAVQTFQGARQTWELPKDLSLALAGLGQQEKSTLFMTLLAAFKTLLYRYTGQTDILVGSPIANRNRSETESLIGFFVNTLVLRSDLNGNPTFRELLRSVREVALGAYAHQDVPIEKLVEELQPERDLSYSPLFQVAFALQNGLTQTLELPGLTLKSHEIDTGTANFDLMLFLEETERGLTATWEYSTNLFQPSTIARMHGHFQILLEGIIANADRRLDELPLLSDRERHQLLVEWNNTRVDYPKDSTIHQMFEARAQQTPDAIAVVFEDQKLTYGELNKRANQVAHYLQKLGVKPEVRVGIYVDRSLEMVVGLLGIIKAGGAYVPLDPAYSSERLSFMLEDAKVQVLLAQSHLDEKIRDRAQSVVFLDSDWENIAIESKENCLSDVTPDCLAYVIYTSGSTGKPKGVQVNHRSAVHLFAATYPLFNFSERDAWTVFHSYAFDFSVWEIWGALVHGCKLVIVPLEVTQSPSAFYQLLCTERVTILNQTPSAIRQLIDAQKTADREPKWSLGLIICGGEALPAELASELLEWNLPLWNFYGPTEATVWTAIHPIKSVESKRGSIPIGRPLPNTQLYILDANLQPVPVGVLGQLYIGGAGLSRGYLNLPELTAQKFIPNPFCEEIGARLYKTGDIARYLQDGTIEFLGRSDNQVKIRGFRIELGEIEAVLSQHPAVRESVVLLGEDNSGENRLVAYIVSSSEFSTEQPSLISKLRGFLKEKLPQYMIPSAFVLLEALPLTSNGKIDRRSLRAPDVERSELNAAFAPRTGEEQLLAEIWSQVLGVKQIGIGDNFFELGGHSLLATQLIAKVREAFQVELPLRSLFQYPTVESLAAVISQQKRDAVKQVFVNSLPVITPDPEGRHQPFGLTDIQQAYWIGRTETFELGGVATHIYAEIESVNLDLERFSKAWQQLIDRHEMLRAIVRPDGQQQILERVPAYQIQVLDLRGQNYRVVNSQMEAVRESLSHQVIPSDRWPLFEIRASVLDDRRVRLHFSFDALIADAWSFQMLGREWAKLYQNPNEILSDIEISFRDYVFAELACRHTEEYRRSVDYWQSRIPTLPPAPDLPLVKNPAAIKKPRFERRTGQLDPKTWQQLKNKSTKAGSTPSGILLAAFAEVLAVWSKNPRFTIGLTLFNRLPLHPQVNEIAGDFTSLILLAVDNSARDSFAARVRRLQEQLWDDLDHRYFSGVQVLRELLRQQGSVSAALMPVVFTSTLTQNAEGEQNFPLHWLGETVCAITQTPQVFLDVQVSEEAGALVFNWDAVEELFPAGMLDDMFATYSHFLQRLADESEIWQEANPQLLPATQLQQRAAINATDAPVPAEMLHTLFAARVPLHPQKVAVVATHRTLTYEELYRRSRALGYRLQKLGARPNTLVAVVMEKGWEQVVACLGILMSGAAYVPVDPALPKERRSHLFAQADVEIAVTQSGLEVSLDWPENLQRICADTEELTDEFHQPLEPVQTPEDLAYVIYTSGSTGVPKGVIIDHRGAVNTIADINQRFGVGAGDRVLALSSLSFDLSVYDIFGTLAAGGTIVLPESSAAQDPARWAELMVRENISIWNSVPALMQMMVEYAACRSEVFQNLRLVLLSGDWLPLTLPGQIKSLRECVQVVSLGGATEASIWSILYPIEEVSPDWKSVPYGKPMKNQRFYVFDEALEPRPISVPGQLYIGGIGLAKGYWRNPEKTAASFITHPVTGERLYRTGDLGRFLPDGNIEFLGREDFRIKIRGYRIEAGEIEAALNQHPAVRSCVVTAFGEERSQKRLVAYVVPQQNTAPEICELRQFLSQKLPEYMLPSAFVMLEALPLSANGKVDHKALPAPDAAFLPKTFVAPGTPVEKVLAGIWAEILGVEKISIHDNFFIDLGGHSLLATQIISAVRDTFGVDVPMRSFFESPTASEQAAALVENPAQREKVENTAQLLLSLAELSDEEVERMLAEKTSLPDRELTIAASSSY
ncbi:non-ribosomal peptide synthetase [Microcoleus vaginatus GB1-A2]|uniref:non-ribosomal peptide synthetase n=1 Tax=Microcoleus vaginatus TaxID=119532 RepID=UPI001686D2D7|nr:amino acid adenylation domain-containing protein [Microcoleus sp. FACHB-61]